MIDLFASRLNKQLKHFVSYRPDPEALYINAFTIDWGPLDFYCFPPFSCIGQCVQKIIFDNAKGIIIVPNWPNQPWFPCLKRILSAKTTYICPTNPTRPTHYAWN